MSPGRRPSFPSFPSLAALAAAPCRRTSLALPLDEHAAQCSTPFATREGSATVTSSGALAVRLGMAAAFASPQRATYRWPQRARRVEHSSSLPCVGRLRVAQRTRHRHCRHQSTCNSRRLASAPCPFPATPYAFTLGCRTVLRAQRCGAVLYSAIRSPRQAPATTGSRGPPTLIDRQQARWGGPGRAIQPVDHDFAARLRPRRPCLQIGALRQCDAPPATGVAPVLQTRPAIGHRLMAWRGPSGSAASFDTKPAVSAQQPEVRTPNSMRDTRHATAPRWACSTVEQCDFDISRWRNLSTVFYGRTPTTAGAGRYRTSQLTGHSALPCPALNPAAVEATSTDASRPRRRDRRA